MREKYFREIQTYDSGPGLCIKFVAKVRAVSAFVTLVTKVFFIIRVIVTSP